MLPGTDGPGHSPERPFIIRVLRHNLPVVVFLILSLSILLAVYIFFSPDADSLEAVADSAAIDLGGSNADGNAPIAPIAKPIKPKPVTQRLAQSPPPQRIGLIAGHRGSDRRSAGSGYWPTPASRCPRPKGYDVRRGSRYI